MVSILIAKTQDDALASVIAEALQESPDFNMVPPGVVVPAEQIERMLDIHRPDAVLIFGNEAPDSEALLRKHGALVVSRIAIGPDAARFDLRELGLEQLKGTLRALASQRVRDACQPLHVFEIVTSSAVGASVRATTDICLATSSLRTAMAWVDTRLLQYNATRPDSGHVPGLPLGRDAVTRLLVPAGSEDFDESQGPETTDHAWSDLTAALATPDLEAHAVGALHHALGLSQLETGVLLFALAPELDPRYQHAYASFHDDTARRYATLPLACRLLGDPISLRQSLERTGNLIRWRLLQHDAQTLPGSDSPLHVDPSVAAWLLGRRSALTEDPRLRPVIQPEKWPGETLIRRPTDANLRLQLIEYLQCHRDRDRWIVLSGDPDGWRALVESVGSEHRMELVRVPLAAFAHIPAADLADALARLSRWIRLAGAIPVVDAVDGDLSTLLAAVERHVLDVIGDASASVGRPCIVIASQSSRTVELLPSYRSRILTREAPGNSMRSTAIAAAAADAGVVLEPDSLTRIAATFQLPLPAIGRAVQLALANGLATSSAADREALLSVACRQVASPSMPRFARRIEPCFELDDVVLPADRRAQLDEMVTHVREASTVLDAWGFRTLLPMGRGVAALFWGPSGTGKTMAAQAIARELDTDLYQVDLSRVVSKYIGETEKQLDAIFIDAERARAVLLFDEADALFGKRSEVKEAHDRYANLEVAYLLQRIEAFEGVAILTTNLKQSVDTAFLRRLRFIVEFQKPDAKAREAIWRRSIPKAAPVDREVDFQYLARKLELSGGNIRQITLRAAFAAARERAKVVGMAHLVSATRAELIKLGMPAAERELLEYGARFAPEAFAA